MDDCLKFYINGAWVEPSAGTPFDIINPANEQVIGQVMLGNGDDVNAAVAAAKAAFGSYSRTSVKERLELLDSIIETYKKHLPEMAETISKEMGAPMWLANAAHAPMGMAHLATVRAILADYAFQQEHNGTMIVKEPVGVCGLITPWNWPVNQIACKVAPALAAGCTMVLKPSEIAPLNATLWTQILDEAGVPKGVFNLVHGDGPNVGDAMSSHPDIDMMSFTGSTRAGVMVAKSAADTVKRVAQELGGKSANIILDDADFNKAVAQGVQSCFMNTGQSCNAPTRMLVPSARHDEAVEIAKQAAAQVKVGDPQGEDTTIGPVVSEMQYDKVQGLIGKAIEEGTELVCGGTGKPDGLNAGYYVKPTIFANVTNDMTVAREEVFGPVLSILKYQDEAEAIDIANDTIYGLSGYVQGEVTHARKVAAQMRTGNVHINGAGPDVAAPFGGYKQSGNGREWGTHGFEDFLETKAILGYAAK
ncbi:MAG: aldehyde dehydrogenase family protein [Alphaproteobacteria bacterium]|nr:aldehyde dehydrogenase family protein [Alphaproteobacteria bacterium]MBE8220288.1 aldehyde dehydrogenase family protein [Alphaproteobacteria bacterium]